MVSILKRMRKLKTLMQIRLGRGAATFPSSSPVTRLHLTYAVKAKQGHLGARKFWRLCLPRLKYYNPGLGISIKQTEEQTGPALLSVYFAKSAEDASQAATTRARDSPNNSSSDDSAASPSSSTSASVSDSGSVDRLAPAPLDSERVSVIDIKGKDEAGIWKEFRELTDAQEVEATETDIQELESVMAADKQSEVDRNRVAAIRQKKKDQEAMLRAAKEDVQKLRAE